ncbi:MAG: putative ATPase, partial [Limisphaerales bacterium]
RIFISSPGDVAEERNRAQAVVERLQTEFADVLHLEPLLWEQEPLLASADFQSQIRSPADFDIFATIIGARLGSPLGDRFTRDDGSLYASGTEFEFEVAINSFFNKGSPELLVYRKRPGEKNDYLAEQRELVDGFFDKWFLDDQSKTATGAYHWFEQAQQFEEVFTLHLRKLLRRFLPRPNNIPEPLSSFVGRRALLNEVKGQIFDPGTRLLTLVGAGGTGKSRVALRVAKDVLPDFDDGVFFVSLANLRQANLIASAIASAMGVKQTDGREIVDDLIDALRNKSVLLVLDNLEQIQAAGSHINTLMSSCPELKIMATSRSNLRLTGAKSITVSPLAVPSIDRASLTTARHSDAVSLFVARAQAARPDFELSEENYRDVLNICTKLDGLPLAIELATSRLRSMDIARLLRSMDKRFAVLKGGADDLLDHQKSLRALVSWSYELLSDEEQMLWRRMAVFAGSFTMEAAEDVCDPDDEFVVDVEVEQLADNSLATISFDGEPRVQMLGTLREFAIQELTEVGEFATYMDRFVDWTCTLSHAAQTGFDSDNSDATLATVDLEHENIMAAIAYCQETQDPRAQQIASGLWYHWFERGYIAQASELLMPTLTDDSLATEFRAPALKGMASVARFQKDLATAQTCGEKALALYEELADVGGQAAALGELGAIEISNGNLDLAAQNLDRAIEMRETLANERHLSFLMATRGVVFHLAGQLEEAKAFYTKALDLGSHTGDRDSRASALVNMGEIAEAQADVENAYRYYRDSLQLFFERGKKVAIAYCAEVLAGLSAKSLNQPGHAALLFGFTASLREQTNTPIESFNEARLNEDIAATKAALGEQEFGTQWQTGNGLHLEDFLSYMESHESTSDEGQTLFTQKRVDPSLP